MAKVGIIVPIYNVENYISVCVESILAQTFQDFEVILVDDGSTDKSGSICDEYVQRDKRITVVHKKNGGPAEARNYGLEKNKSEYIVFIDADDWIDSRYLEILYGCIREKHADLGICYETYVQEEEEFIFPQFDYSDIVSKAETVSKAQAYKCMMISGQATVCAWGKIYHRSLFYSIRYPVGELYEDCKIIDQIVEKSRRIICIPYAGYFYLIRKGSATHSELTGKHMPAINNAGRLLELVREKYPEIEEAARAYFLLNGLRLFSGMIKNPGYKKECDYLRRAIRKEKKGTVRNPYMDLQTKCSIYCLCMGPLFYKAAAKSYFTLKSFFSAAVKRGNI